MYEIERFVAHVCLWRTRPYHCALLLIQTLSTCHRAPVVLIIDLGQYNVPLVVTMAAYRSTWKELVCTFEQPHILAASATTHRLIQTCDAYTNDMLWQPLRLASLLCNLQEHNTTRDRSDLLMTALQRLEQAMHEMTLHSQVSPTQRR